MEVPSRYYDLNTTKSSSEESKKLTVTYYPMSERSFDSFKNTEGSFKMRLTAEVALYVLLFATGVILILKASFT